MLIIIVTEYHKVTASAFNKSISGYYVNDVATEEVFFYHSYFISGACHGDDMPYFFGGLMVEPLTEEEIKLHNIGLDVLYSYAHNG